MAVPKKKNSKQKRYIAHSQDKIEPKSVGTCSKCGKYKLSHFICKSCE